MAHPKGEIEQGTEALFQGPVARDFALDIADQTAEPGVQELQFPPCALELVGVKERPTLMVARLDTRR